MAEKGKNKSRKRVSNEDLGAEENVNSLIYGEE